MKFWLVLTCMLVCVTGLSQESHYSTETQILSVPELVLDGTTFLTDVKIELDVGSGNFRVLAGNESEFPTATRRLELAYHETEQLLDASALTFTAVLSDSRCPHPRDPGQTIDCITEGFVEVELVLQVQESGGASLRLTLPGLSSEPGPAGPETGGWYFRLLEVTPYPVYPQEEPEDNDYSIIIEYTKSPF